MVITSKYNALTLPRGVSVPEFVLRDVEGEEQDKALLLPSSFNTRSRAKPLTLADLRATAYALATQLLSPEMEGGVWKKGDTVLFLTENQHDFLPVALGVMLAGGIPALLNPQYQGEELAAIMQQVLPRAMFVSPATYAQVTTAVETYAKSHPVPSLYVFDEEHERSLHTLLIDPGAALRAQGNRAVEDVPCIPETDAAVYCFSSGTSGPPKVVCLSHANLIANVIQTTVALGGRVNKPRFDDANWYDQPLGPAQDGTHEVHLSILPQFHCYGLLTALCAVHTATPSIVFARFHVEHFFATVQEEKVTFMFVVPPMLLALATSPLADKYDISTIKSFASGAASLSQELCALVMKRHGIKVTDGYGMTEMSPLIALQTLADIPRGQLDVGLLVPNTEARIVDLETREDVPAGKTGELLLRGPQMMLGYHHNDAANAAAFVPNATDPARFFKSGDIVSIDADGTLRYSPRLSAYSRPAQGHHQVQRLPNRCVGAGEADQRMPHGPGGRRGRQARFRRCRGERAALGVYRGERRREETQGRGAHQGHPRPRQHTCTSVQKGPWRDLDRRAPEIVRRCADPVPPERY